MKKKFNYPLPTQQTPNPDAQLPVAVPPFLEHSEEVKHVPLRPVDVVHGVFENRTIEKRDMTKKFNHKSFIMKRNLKKFCLHLEDLSPSAWLLLPNPPLPVERYAVLSSLFCPNAN
jgi:hypothetical protein